VNRFSGANISTIAIEVPIRRITSDGKPAATTKDPIIGVYANTARRKVRELGEHDDSGFDPGPWVQVSRMANPLVNELIITTPFKDDWNAAEPEDEANFQAFYKNPVVATELNLVFGVPIVPIDNSPADNRTDLMGLLLKYPGQALNGTSCGRPCAELLRLDLRVPPPAPASQSRPGAAWCGEPAGCACARAARGRSKACPARSAGGVRTGPRALDVRAVVDPEPAVHAGTWPGQGADAPRSGCGRGCGSRRRGAPRPGAHLATTQLRGGDRGVSTPTHLRGLPSCGRLELPARTPTDGFAAMTAPLLRGPR
jgi:hypothetical protein